ncbi:MAG: type II secretion system protein GspN [Deltaproteobacteria bacterium CG11_big_fil_rev_8_21_14_0_20_49_13]|nr:MAG: type II secretion system protein GspN [Deltaproteobacteria bacterium CG11_big_fil_rev_8_21_14_0_20_49_13]
MPKLIRYVGYIVLFVISFFFFLYWTFPYDILKERMVQAAMQQLGGDYDVRISDFSPSFFTGATLKNVKILKHSGDQVSTTWEASKIKARTSLSSLLFGRSNVSFDIINKKSEIEGSYKATDEGFNFESDLSDFNIGDMGFLTGDGTAKLVSAIDGSIRLNINNKQIIQSTGSANLDINNITLKEGELRFGEGGAFNVPELFLAKKGSTIKIELSKGSIKVKELKLKDGDLNMDLTGDIFMSSSAKNYRMNLRGTFSVSQKLEQAVPILFMVEKQKQPDGTYPITITGRLGQPSIKIGDFTLPL